MTCPSAFRAVAALALLPLLAAAQTTEVRPPQFEGGVEVVAVDANVVDGKGKPVPDVGIEEFVVKVDGRPRRVLSARFVEMGRPAAPEPSLAPAPAPDPAPTTAVGRRVILVVDRGELGAGAVHTATQAAAKLFDQLTPDDRAAIFSVPSGPRVDFTADRAALDKALRKIGPAQEIFMGEFNIGLYEALVHVERPSRSNVAGRECIQYSRSPAAYENCVGRVDAEARRQLDDHQRRVEDRLNAIEALCQAMVPLPGPKVIVLISGGFTSVMGSWGGPDVIHRMRTIATAAAAARISLYSLYLSQRHQSRGAWRSRELFSPEQDQEMRAEGLETLTGMAGGALFEVMAGADWAFTRVASEISGHYLLGLEPGEEDRDGKPHDIEVKVSRKGVQVRARRQFVMNMAATPGAGGPVAAVAAASAPLPLRVATHVLRGASAGQVRLVVTAQADGVADATFAIRVLDAVGGVVGNLTQRVNSPELWRVRYEEAVLLPPGQYVVKTGAVDADGRRQVIDTKVDAGLVRGDGVDASDLLLLAADGDRMRLPASGSIRGERLGLYLELYPPAGASARPIAVTIQLIAPDGAPRLTTVLPVGSDAAKGLLYVEGSLPLRALEPGRYRARALVMVGDAVAATVEREFDYEGGPIANR